MAKPPIRGFRLRLHPRLSCVVHLRRTACAGSENRQTVNRNMRRFLLESRNLERVIHQNSSGIQSRRDSRSQSLMTPLKQALFTDTTDSGDSRSDTDTALRGQGKNCMESSVFPSISLAVSFTATKRDSERRHGGIALWRPKANYRIR